ncbi:MAG: acetate/propionate family kinase [Nitrospira sp.]|nr:acetate/propionate family kinase [Nitrospira sp.]MDH5347081.1 acetate/propionate family kinase [Nitrospira sp.]MDH5496134.1 acetate/propionate family kinase [Nitrospira sp.]MDH5726488.1 acetate/propionate family kinase [Nitrospira sp.]
MPHADDFVLTINGGSSSLKFALFQETNRPVALLRGMIDRIGLPESILIITNREGGQLERRGLTASDPVACVGVLIGWLERQIDMRHLRAIGHRVVHGGLTYSQPEPVTPGLLAELRRISPYDPEHMPSELALIEAFGKRDPKLPQFACFDTAFHRDMPRVARLLSIPRRFDKSGVQRYGFHGLSYAFLMKELARVGKKNEADGRVILAHLGNGASMAAIKDGKSLDTTMGFTPTSGLPMSRRSGDLDPGLISYLARTEGMSPEQFHKMVNTESGLLGVSETSSDMRDLLKEERNDVRAAEAVALFCYHVKRYIGSLAAALGGLDTLVFSAGIGEHSPIVRARICEGLEFLGIVIDSVRNEAGEAVISKESSNVTVRVIHTNEESEIARSVMEMIGAEL